MAALLGKALSKVWKYVAVAAAGIDIRDMLLQPNPQPAIEIPKPPVLQIPPFHDLVEDDNLSKEEILVLCWAGLAMLFAIFAVITICKCISMIRYKPDA